MRGGKRPGAGAPKGNMNALKHGLYSKTYASVGKLLAEDPTVRDALLKLGERMGVRQRKANEIAAMLLVQHLVRAREIGGDRLTPDLPADVSDSINLAARKAARRALKSSIKKAVGGLKNAKKQRESIKH